MSRSSLPPTDRLTSIEPLPGSLWLRAVAAIQEYFNPRTREPEMIRRARMLDNLLISMSGLTLLAFILNAVGYYTGEFEANQSLITMVVCIFYLTSAIVIFYLNRRISNRLAALTFILVIILGLFLGDSAFNTVRGRNMLPLAIPIVMAGIILRPVTAFLVAALIGILSLYVSARFNVPPNYLGILLYLSIALISWLTTRSLEQAVAELRETNAELDQRVAERTNALYNSVEALQRQMVERRAAEEALQEAHDELEARVAQRTRELSVANAQLQREVVERKRTEKELERNLHRLSLSNAELEQFAYVTSHDLREPLRKVRSFTELLQDRYEDKLDERGERYMHYIIDGASRMQTLISDLLTYSRVGRLDTNVVDVDLDRLLNQIVGDLSILIDETEATVTFDDLPTVQADQSRLWQLFQNLINNGIKFRRPDTPPVIHVSVTGQGDDWQFAVSDNGIGIPAEFSERVFLIFQRLHTREAYQGTGIGLAICKKIVQELRGEIWFESEVGVGTTFYFTIPRRNSGVSVIRQLQEASV